MSMKSLSHLALHVIKGLKIILTKKDRGGFIFGDCPKGNLSPYPGQSSPAVGGIRFEAGLASPRHRSLFRAQVLEAPRGLLLI